MNKVIDVELPRDPGAARVARQHVGAQFSALQTADLHTVKLLVSELVNNAVLHGRGRISMQGSIAADRVRVEVIDEGNGFDPRVRKSRFDDERGRGLLIVDSQSSRWGVHDGTTTVWFEIDLD